MKQLLLLLPLLLAACAGVTPQAPTPEAPDEFSRINSVLTGNGQRDHFGDMLQAYRENPAFSCQHPAYFRYFRESFPDEPSASEPCKQPVPFHVSILREGIKTIWIDPARVSAIHLVFAGKGSAMMSRFGHVSLRLVVCPEHNPTAERCDANLREHLVLGFMANVNDLELDTLKALQGGYQAYLFANRFMDVYQGYAIAEFREIYSLPLEIEAERRIQMVRELSEIHWRFADQYRFFSKNCTGHLQSALLMLLPDMQQSDDLSTHYARPDRFFEALLESPILDESKIASLERAEQEGFYFPSTKPFYEKALDVVRQAIGSAYPETLNDYINTMPDRRLALMKVNSEYWQRLASEEYLRDAQLMLEELTLTESERRLMREAMEYIREDFPKEIMTIRMQLDDEQKSFFEECFVEPMKQIAQPIRREKQVPDQARLVDDLAVAPVCHQPGNAKKTAGIFMSIDSDSTHWQKTRQLVYYHAEAVNNISTLNNLDRK